MNKKVIQYPTNELDLSLKYIRNLSSKINEMDKPKSKLQVQQPLRTFKKD